MEIVGIQKFSMIDYPGKSACVVFLPGCNFRCHYCYNYECVLLDKINEIRPNFVKESDFFDFLNSRIGLLDGVSICGGETTLHKDLYQFIKKIKNLGFCVKLDTNGRDYKIVEKLINDNLIDYVAVDIKHSITKYEDAVGVKLGSDFFENFENLLSLLLNTSIDYEYRTTVVDGLHTMQDIIDISKYIKGIKNYYIQNFIPGDILNPKANFQSFDNDHLLQFQTISSQYVDSCIIRN